jgi:succinate dehydrogenase / fumarate reductase membrane anchor subunit
VSLRSPLARVRGLGATGEGTSHWWAQRLTALALVPLTLWFAAALATLAGADHAAVSAWAGSPVVAGLLVLLVVTTFYHSYLGLQVVIEDYVGHEVAKLIALLLVKGGCLVLGLVGVLSVLLLLVGSPRG